MEATTPLVKKITNYLGRLNADQQKAVLGVVKTFAQEGAWWDDKEYIAEMDKRFSEMENGKVKSITLDELETGARQAYRSKKLKKK